MWPLPNRKKEILFTVATGDGLPFFLVTTMGLLDQNDLFPKWLKSMAVIRSVLWPA